MQLEDKLARLDNCLTQKGSHGHNHNQSEILKSCYFQMNSLRKGILQQPSLLLPSSTLELPKIYSLHPVSDSQHLAHSFSSITGKEQTLQNSFSGQFLPHFLDQSGQGRKFSRASLIKTEKAQSGTSSIINSNQHDSLVQKSYKRQKKEKENKWRKIKQNRPRIVLGRQQRYFQVREVAVDPQAVQQRGLYVAGILFKTKNIAKNLQELTVVAEKPDFNPIRLGNNSDLFVTNIQPGPEGFSLETFIEEELGRHITSNPPIPEKDSFVSQNTLPEEQAVQAPESTELQITSLFLTFKDYQLVKDQSYFLFKTRHLSSWGSILLNVKKVAKCLENQKVKMVQVKEDHLTLWDGQKTTHQKFNELLGLKDHKKAPKSVQKIVRGFIGRLKVAVMRRRIKHRECQIRWVAQRLKAIYVLRQKRKEKIQKAKELQKKLLAEPDWEVEVHIPSFSVDSFKRSTTQYMESFQAQYHCLWQSSSVPLILVLPSINENLLKLLQLRLRLSRPVTIITPEIYSIFPPNLSLAAQVYFSHETLLKIEKAVGGRAAVLIGSNFSDSIYEMLISEFLDIPLLSSIKSGNQGQQEKAFFRQAGINTPLYSLVSAGTSSEQLLQIFAELLLNSPAEKSWILKVRGEFKGRGIATVKLNPAKYVKKGMDQQRMKSALMEALRSTLRLKLKVNFENSVYMVEDFMHAFLKEGGVIEQLKDTTATYEFCFKKVRQCELKSTFKVYGGSYANKVWLTASLDAPLRSLVQRLKSKIQRDSNFLGYLSVVVSQTSKSQFLGIDLKQGQSLASSMSSFAEMIDRKRNLHGNQALNVQQLPTKRVSTNDDGTNEASHNHFRYLFIPAFPFTDVDELAKSKLIEELMGQCWNDRHLRLGYAAKIFLSLGLDFSAVVMGRDLKRIKREGVELVRQLAERIRSVREYRGKQVVRDVFEYGDVIRAISQIKAQE